MNLFIYDTDDVLWNSKDPRVRRSETAGSTEEAWLRGQKSVPWTAEGEYSPMRGLREERREEEMWVDKYMNKLLITVLFIIVQTWKPPKYFQKIGSCSNSLRASAVWNNLSQYQKSVFEEYLKTESILTIKC